MHKIFQNLKTYFPHHFCYLNSKLKNDFTAWETTMKNKGTPLLVYYNNWVKTNFTKKKSQAIQSEDNNDYDMPSIKRKLPGTEKSKETQDGPVELFPSDDENDDLEIEQQPKPKKAKKEKKIVEHVDEDEDDDDFNYDGVDIVKDLDLDDW